MKIAKSERFCLSTSTFGVRIADGTPGNTVTIPRDSVVEIVSDIETPQKMIEVDWQGLRVMMFVQDIQERGTLVGTSKA